MNTISPELKAIFWDALDYPTEAERWAYLDHACGADEGLRARVEALLRAYRDAGDFLEHPVSMTTTPLDGPAFPEAPGTVIGHYTLEEQIGEGGMGVVYVAEQTLPVRRKVALKVIKPGMDSKQVIARFEAERQALAMMDHPNIAKVYDGGTTESGRPYFVMELVRGVPLTEYCDQAQLSIRERLALFVLLCRAVQHAHQKGIIHRDIKPTNVLITLHDGAPVPKVIDFGIAKATGRSLTDKTLETGLMQLVGTPLYMSPEQAELSGLDVDTRSDLYSLGVLLYELLTGTTPFDRETFRTAALDEMRRIIREEEPPKPSTRLSALGQTITAVSANRESDPRQLNRVVRGELDWIVMRSLEKDRRRRYQTANDFAADVARYLEDRPVEACPPSAWYRFGKFASRNRGSLATAALVALALAAGLAGSVAMAVWAIDAERRTAAALVRVREGLAESGRQRAYARKAVDEMYTQVAEKWLEREGGMTPLQQEFLEKALAFYEEFARGQGDDPEARAEAAKAAARVGEIRAQIGRSAGAMESYGRSIALFRRLAAEFPDRPEFRRGLAFSLTEVGRQQETLGRTGEAERAYRDALALREQLLNDPGTPADRAELTTVLRGLGLMLGSIDRAADGESALLRSVDLLARLVREFPRESRYQSMLASAEMNLGVLYARVDRKAESEACYRRSLELRQTLANADPDDAKSQYALAQCYHNIGTYYSSNSRFLLAADEFRKALPLEETLAARHPDRPRYRELLAQTLCTLAGKLINLGQLDEAEKDLRRSIEVSETLVADFPDVPIDRNQLASSVSEMGALQAHLGRNREARGAFERAVEIQRKLAADHPHLSAYRQNLVGHCYTAAVNLATLNDAEDQDRARALELAREAVRLGPDVSGSWKALALAEYCAGDHDAALEAETRALEIRKSDGYMYDWLLMALIHLGRGDREQATLWALQVFHDRDPGFWLFPQHDLERLARKSEPRLRALIPAQAEELLALLERGLEAHRRDRGPGDPATLRRSVMCADRLAVMGRYDEAAARLEDARRLEPRPYPGELAFGPWFPLAVLRLRAREADAYRALCREMLERFAKTPQKPIASLVSRLCTATPWAVDDPAPPLALGQFAAAGREQDVQAQLARGAAEFRAGLDREAVETLAPILSLRAHASGRAQAALFLAMARQRLGRAEEARSALAQADRIMQLDPNRPETLGMPARWNWRERMLCQTLRREAVAALSAATDEPAGPDGTRSGPPPVKQPDDPEAASQGEPDRTPVTPP